MLTWLMNAIVGSSLESEDPEVFEDHDFRKPTAQVVSAQLYTASLLGLFAFLSFSVLLKKLPRLYASRKYKEDGNLRLPSWGENTLFGWLAVVYRIRDQQVLEYAGLDAFVFLGFFKMGIKLLAVCSFFSICIISPIRYHFTGRYDDGGDEKSFKIVSELVKRVVGSDGDGKSPETARGYLWMYVLFTYFFTLLAIHLLVSQTRLVVNTRQAYLGKQNTITDRTIRLMGMPIELRETEALKRKIEELNIGKVSSITICREWGPLNRLFKYREKVLRELELKYADCPPDEREREYYSENYRLRREGSPQPDSQAEPDLIQHTDEHENRGLYSQIQLRERPKVRTGAFGILVQKLTLSSTWNSN